MVTGHGILALSRQRRAAQTSRPRASTPSGLVTASPLPPSPAPALAPSPSKSQPHPHSHSHPSPNPNPIADEEVEQQGLVRSCVRRETKGSGEEESTPPPPPPPVAVAVDAVGGGAVDNTLSQPAASQCDPSGDDNNDATDEREEDEAEQPQGSILGTKEHWEGAYIREVAVFEESGGQDVGEVWFGDDTLERVCEVR